MIGAWRPYEPSLEAERSSARTVKIGPPRNRGRVVRTREEARELFGAGSFLAEGIPLPCELL